MGKYANGILVCRDDSGRDTIPSHQMNLSNDSVATDALLGGYKRWTNDGQTMDNSWINASSHR